MNELIDYEQQEKTRWDGQAIKRLLKRDGKGQQDLADHVGVTRQSVNSWIKGTLPRGDRFLALCKYFNVGPESFIKVKKDQTSLGSIGFFN